MPDEFGMQDGRTNTLPQSSFRHVVCTRYPYMSIERRSENRELRCIPTNIEGQGDSLEHVALVHDASGHGVTLFTREPHAIGEHLLLELHTDLGSAALPTTGKVVHCERRNPALSDLWTWQLGLELDTSLAAYEAEVEALSEKQRTIGVLPR